MPEKPKTVELDLDEDLIESLRLPTSMSLPLALHRRLDVLAELAKAAKSSRAEIISMLIANAELDSEKLERQIMDYRRLSVGDVFPEASEEEGRAGSHNVVRFERRKPGRPRSEAG